MSHNYNFRAGNWQYPRNLDKKATLTSLQSLLGAAGGAHRPVFSRYSTLGNPLKWESVVQIVAECWIAVA